MKKEFIYNIMAFAGAAALVVFPCFWTLGALIATSVAIGTFEVMSN